MIKAWSDDAWADYTSWVKQGEWKTVKRINALVTSIDRTPFDGLGKTEPLKHELSGLWSRRIDQVNRLIYDIVETEGARTIQIYACRDHY